MTAMLRTVIVDSDAESRLVVRRMLVTNSSVMMVGEYARVSEALRDAPLRRPDLAVVEVTDAAGPQAQTESSELIQSLTRSLPDCAILAMGPSVSADFVLKVMRAGAIEFLKTPVDRDDLKAALDKVVRLRPSAEPERRVGRVTSVFSTKGGLGATTLATNLAICIAERLTEGTLLVDFDTTRPSDVATLLNLNVKYSILDALENISRLDESFLRGLVVRHETGLWVLPGPAELERVQLTAGQIQDGLKLMRQHYAHLVLDLRHDLDPGTLAALEASDKVLFLTSLNVSALRSGASGLSTLRKMGLDEGKLKVVVMREGGGDEVTVKQAQEVLLGMPIFWRTPSDYHTVVSSINNGQPVVTASPRSKVAKNFRDLAEALVPGPWGNATEPSPKSVVSLLRLVWNSKGSQGGE